MKEKKCITCGYFISYEHKQKPEECPNCKSKYWDKPLDEKCLFNLQDDYINNGRNPNDLSPMYLKLKEYAANIIKHKLRNKKILSKADFNDKANDIALIMIERFLRNPEEKINHSFGGMMMWIANGVLYGKRKEDQVDSLSNTFFDSENEIMDNIYTLSSSSSKKTLEDSDPQNNLSNFMSNEDLIDEVYLIIDKIYNIVVERRKKLDLLYLLGVYHFLTGQKESFFIDWNNLVSSSTKKDIENTKLFIRKYLKEQLSL